ncbi:conserved membrane hypothetical protein [Tenacibaculum maritimum]|nr:conserved membrane hypothetical protein [Tenacibaculum maritimum]
MLSHLLMGSVIAFVIAISPLIFYSYKFGVFPKEKTLETPFFTLTSYYYEDVSAFAWVFFGKFIPLYLLCIWFFTCRYWWYWSILIPIGMYFFQLTSLFSEEFKLKDEPIELVLIFPYMLIIGVGLYFVRKRIMTYIELFNLKEQIENEIYKVEKEKN